MTLALIMAAALAASAAPAAKAPFDRAAWQSDYERLKVALAQGYANLDWQVARRGLNLARADGQIAAMLAKVDSDAGAALVFAKLVAAFDDPHLDLRPGPPPAAASLVPQQSDVDGAQTAAPSCDDGRYADGPAATRLPYTAAPGWVAVSDGPFQAGLIGDIGILRIPAFGEDRYLSVCRAVARPGMDARALQLATRAELNHRLTALVGTLKARGMRRLAIDLSGNGGGTEWSSEAVTLFTAGRLTRNEPRRAGPACDRSAIWKGKDPPCPVYAGAPTVEWIESDGPPPWTGPRAVLVDRRTGSAAEEFVAWMRDNARARIGGEKTAGAGCGYVDGGNAFAFKAAPIHLMMPNCSRIMKDGTNEVEGQTPDVAIDWRTLTPAQVPETLAKLF